MNIYENRIPLTTVKVAHGGPKKGGSVNITTPVNVAVSFDVNMS